MPLPPMTIEGKAKFGTFIGFTFSLLLAILMLLFSVSRASVPAMVSTVVVPRPEKPNLEKFKLAFAVIGHKEKGNWRLGKQEYARKCTQADFSQFFSTVTFTDLEEFYCIDDVQKLKYYSAAVKGSAKLKLVYN